MAAQRQWTWLLMASALMGGCYYHAMAGPAVATAGGARAGGLVTLSSGLNGAIGGAGLNASGSFFDGQYTGMVGLEAFRLWRGEQETGFQPYTRAALGLLELGVDHNDFLLGGLSPRAEAGITWLGRSLQGLTLSVAAEYRLRDGGLSTPIFWLQVGFGGFDYVGSSTAR